MCAGISITAAVRSGIVASRDSDHSGDTHAMFAHHDDDQSGHLSEEELYTLLGVPKVRRLMRDTSCCFLLSLLAH